MKASLIAAVCIALAVSGSAFAQSTLVTTEITESGHIEFEADFAYSHTNRSVTNAPGVRTDTFDSNYFFGVGLPGGFEVSAAIPYTFYDRTKSGSVSDTKRGEGDLQLGLQYRAIGGGDNPLTAIIGFAAQVPTASSGRKDFGTGVYEYIPSLSVAYRAGDMMRPFFIYEAKIVQNEKAHDDVQATDLPNTHRFTLGTGIKVSRGWTIEPAIYTRYIERTGSSRRYNDIGFDIYNYFELSKNVQLIPSVGFIAETGHTEFKTIEGTTTAVSLHPAYGYNIGIGVYFSY